MGGGGVWCDRAVVGGCSREAEGTAMVAKTAAVKVAMTTAVAVQKVWDFVSFDLMG